MRFSSTVPSDSDTHDDFKPTQKVSPDSTDSLKDIVENVHSSFSRFEVECFFVRCLLMLF